jgi:hypothetical protein
MSDQKDSQGAEHSASRRPGGLSFTEGPWRLSRTRRYVMNGYAAPWICEVCTDQREWEANARLLAASPAMFEALWTIARVSTDWGAQDCARRALRQVFGGAPPRESDADDAPEGCAQGNSGRTP